MSGSNSSNPVAAGEPLSFTVHTPPAVELGDAAQRTRAGRWKLLAVLFVCALPVIASYLSYFVIRPDARTNYAELIVPPRDLPPLALTDLQGRAVDAASLRGQWLLATAGPAACGDACQQRLFMQRQLREMTGRERDRIDKVWFVTDDAPIDAALLAALQAPPAVTVLRVPAADLARWLEPAAGESADAHLYIVDPMGRWMMRPPAQPDPARLKRDIDRLLRASASWDRPGR
jgi:hypothetical protein